MAIPLDRLSARASLAERASDDLRRAIIDGAFAAAGRLPTEPRLAEMLGVSRTTVRHAVSILQQEGLLDIRHGSGTFLAAQASQVMNNLNVNSGLTKLIEAAGKKADVIDVKVMTRVAGVDEAEKLEIEPDSEVIVIERTRTADGEPVALTIELLPSRAAALHGLDADSIRRVVSKGESMYGTMDRYGLVVHHGTVRIQAELAPAALARRLKVRSSSAILFLEQVDYSPDGTPILLSKERIVGERMVVSVYRKGAKAR